MPNNQTGGLINMAKGKACSTLALGRIFPDRLAKQSGSD
jgi:hypothetical protein